MWIISIISAGPMITAYAGKLVCKIRIGSDSGHEGPVRGLSASFLASLSVMLCCFCVLFMVIISLLRKLKFFRPLPADRCKEVPKAYVQGSLAGIIPKYTHTKV
jgi:hypothetical protein